MMAIVAPMRDGMIGLHGPADAAKWAWDGEAFDIITTARIESVKLLAAADVDEQLVAELRARGVKYIVARVFNNLYSYKTGTQYVDEVFDACARLYNAGVRYFELANEPNLGTAVAPEGMWVAWNTGGEFAQWWLAGAASLRARLPGVKVGFPGLSPGGDIGGGVRYDERRFLAEAAQATSNADWIGMHTYWDNNAATMAQSLAAVRWYSNRFAYKPVLITEFANVHPMTPKEVKGMEYRLFYRDARFAGLNIGPAFSYVLSASYGWPEQTWKGSDIPKIVGMR